MCYIRDHVLYNRLLIIRRLFVSATRKAHDLVVETEYIGVLYIIVRVIFQFHFVASLTVWRME